MNTAERGLAFWLSNGLDNYDYVLLLPHRDIAFNSNVLSALEARLESFAERPRVLVLSEETSDDLLSLYCMYEFTDKLIIGSFELPYGRKLKNLLDWGVTEKSLINDVILGDLHEATP